MRAALLITLGLLLTMSSNAQVSKREVVRSYVFLGYTQYLDALKTSQILDVAIQDLTLSPSAKTLENAKAAWIKARPSYQQSEIFNLSYQVIGQESPDLNGWPLDERFVENLTDKDLLDNITNSPAEDTLKAQNLKASSLKSAALNSGMPSHTFTNYHVIEFLLWGEDSIHQKPGAGSRSWRDFVIGENCRRGDCRKRLKLLASASAQLVAELEKIANDWGEHGSVRKKIFNRSSSDNIFDIFKSMAILATDELAGQRIQSALVTGSPEEELDCFSDNTHRAYFDSAQGLSNVYFGTYITLSGDKINVPGLRDFLISEEQQTLVSDIDLALKDVQITFKEIVSAAENGMPFDMMILPENLEGQRLLTLAANHLITLASAIEDAAFVVHDY